MSCAQCEGIDQLFDATDSKYVSMCLDTGHALFAGVDPVKLTNDYIGRIKHVHLKNVRPRVTSDTRIASRSAPVSGSVISIAMNASV